VIDDFVGGLLTGGASAVICTHRPIIPVVLRALGLAEERLEPAEMLVVHHRKGAVVATELLRP